MKRFFAAIRRFFFPPAEASTLRKVLPLASIALLAIVVFLVGNFAWEETNTPAFCGATCHTMPPQYMTYQRSAHTNVSCEDCHMGRDRLFTLIPRKIRYSWQTGSAMILNNYHYPIKAENMAPAREACENCHKPDKFSSDRLIEVSRYAADTDNTLTSVYLSLKTGGGTSREGLGYGIHWHIENPVYYYTDDIEAQRIPYVVVVAKDGTKTEYVDVTTDFNPKAISQSQLKQMDCISCHNRTAHLFQSPERIMESLLERNLVSPKIPSIKRKGVEVLSNKYSGVEGAFRTIESLRAFYNQQYPYFMAENADLLEQAITAMKSEFEANNFFDQKVNWQTHPDNIGHVDSPGCFRCHDGKHMTSEKKEIRLECNVCHSIPTVAGTNKLAAMMPLEKGFEPESHRTPNWIGMHNRLLDDSCAGCHTVEDPGGTSDTSFCSNSVCHGSDWEFTGFNAPSMRDIWDAQAQLLITPTPEATTPPPAAPSGGKTTYASVSKLFNTKCSACHGASNAMAGLNLTSYATIMAGGEDGPVIVAGDPENSKLVKIQSGATKHFGQFSKTELDAVIQWIKDGASE